MDNLHPPFGEKVRASFDPKSQETLRPEWRAYIGKSASWRYAGTMDEGRYAGQQMWITDDPGWPNHWVPAEDLTRLPPTLLYVVGQYEEHATTDARATMDPARLPGMIDALATGNQPWADEAKATLAAVLARPHSETTAKGLWHLHSGWGGAVLYVLRLEEDA